ncbi:hypothetical protein JOC77_001473 [Peribacillus deserti]|uniref:Uncharacterized protein n=1 Tax=Peribacillus deserti TaxID=673318 RepID=A0ABS2QFW4_9BACI|nr:hypothetical protein [Peribacillus deserti]MBM7692046.1 hypothetical protein [Peribacillus deserti]
MGKKSVRLIKREERRKRRKNGESEWGFYIFDVVLELFEYIILGIVHLVRIVVKLIN